VAAGRGEDHDPILVQHVMGKHKHGQRSARQPRMPELGAREQRKHFDRLNPALVASFIRQTSAHS
jgi:hypothetical protein